MSVSYNDYTHSVFVMIQSKNRELRAYKQGNFFDNVLFEMKPTGTKWPVTRVIDFSISEGGSFFDMYLASSSLLFIEKEQFIFAGLSSGFKTMKQQWEGNDNQTFIFKWDLENQTSVIENCLFTNDEILPAIMENFLHREYTN